MNHLTRILRYVLVAGALLLAGCASTGGYGGYGQPSSGYPSQYGQYGSQLQGTVERLDPAYGRLSIITNDPRTGRAAQVDIRYDQRTRLVYQGRESSVQGLERGDVIRVDAVQSGRELWARAIEVVRDVRNGGYGGGYGSAYGNDLRGAIVLVDPRARLIRLDGAGYGNDVQLAYDTRTTVEYQGRLYRPENLQRGDQVRIQARQVGSNLWLAERIIVERSVTR